MLKKYAPYIVLLFAALLLFYVLTKQRGSNRKEHIEVTTDVTNGNEGFNRNPEKITYTKHARCRMACRHIDETEVIEILQTGKVNVNKIEEDNRGKTYPLEGKTGKDKYVRIVVAPRKNETVIVTVIDLDADWECDCSTH